MRALDITVGYQYERWTVLADEFRRTPTGGAYFLCQCACGTEREVLFRGSFQSKSCGCLQREVARETHTTHGGTRAEDGSKTRLYGIWQGMKSRCYGPRRKEYKNYGGRGIYVDPRWVMDDGFGTFQAWALSHGYADDLDLDREDNDEPYSPENCRWITRKVNLNNTRWNRMLTAFGETKSMALWSEDPRCVVGRKAFESRLRLKWDVEDALTVPRNSWNPARKRR